MLNWIKWGIVGAVLGGLAFFHYNTLHTVRKEEQAKYEQLLKESERKALEKQGEILLSSLKLEQEKNDEILRISNYANSLLGSLQQRTSRTEPKADNLRIESSCTGRELFKEDGEFLVREAARAERILEERNYYYNQYEQVRKKLNE